MSTHLPLRVCHFSTSSIDAPYFENMAKGLANAGVFVYCIGLRGATEPGWLREVRGACYMGLDVRSRFGYLLATLKLVRFLRRERVDVLQTHLFDAGIIGSVAARIAGTRLLVVTRHHTDQVALVGTRIHRALDRWMARRADVVVAVSRAVKEYMIEKDGLDSTPIDVIYLGFDFDALQCTEEQAKLVRHELGLGEDFVIGCVARLFATKGQSYLVTALGELATQIPNVRLLLVGDGPRTKLIDLARDAGVADRVVFAGHRSDVSACMGAMDVVVHPSLSEAFSQVVVEAMASGTPLVSTDVGGAREVITDGEDGFLVPPADPSAIVEAVARLHRDHELRRRIGAEGQRSVRRRFTVERMVRSQLDCYRRWCGLDRTNGTIEGAIFNE